MKNLLSVKFGEYVNVDSFDKSTPLKIKRRLLDLGFTKNQRIRTLRKSLIGEAYMVELRGFILTLRRDIVSYILVR